MVRGRYVPPTPPASGLHPAGPARSVAWLRAHDLQPMSYTRQRNEREDIGLERQVLAIPQTGMGNLGLAKRALMRLSRWGGWLPTTAFLSALILATAGSAAAQDNDMCLMCHENEAFFAGKDDPSGTSSPGRPMRARCTVPEACSAPTAIAASPSRIQKRHRRLIAPSVITIRPFSTPLRCTDRRRREATRWRRAARIATASTTSGRAATPGP
jgi:hypothetical protein